MMRRWLMRLFPQGWRRRYEAEFVALLDELPLTPATIFDIVVCALDAHIFPVTPDESVNERMIRMQKALRGSLLTVFCAYIAFIVAGLALYGSVDDSPFARHQHWWEPMGITWRLIMLGAVVALGAAVIGGAPVGISLLKQALWGKRKDIRLLLAVPVGAFCLLAATFVTMALFALNRPDKSALGPSSPVTQIFLAAWGIFFIVSAIASAGAVSLAVLRAPINPALFRFARVPAAITTGAMALMAVSTCAWEVAAAATETHTFSDELGWFAFVSVTMVGATAIALNATRRAFAV